ncbi:hypothetical protein GGTG_12748 [Gaeumannomyces tritici R3-111a-1]|uniref:Uncharacterized protein n=1 Tax=Gaeumannomyces tritici (strain R3-111a-1) TaxID=644352 RepID=J3PGW8_GAET3|nr:hypothetical protein GGTG_12748 [Gaeumannomyces tritici R3-111a-1]EJT69865.1 hypothetical protein GGTG_12748 [Gaeumannomyces tritici R3-111a-1]
MGRARKPSPLKPVSRGPYKPSDGRLVTNGAIYAVAGKPVAFPLIMGINTDAAERWNPKHLVFHLAVHQAGGRGARVPDHERDQLVSWPNEDEEDDKANVLAATAAAARDPFAARTHGDARLLKVHSRTRTMGRTTHHPHYYFEVGGFAMTRPGVYRLAVEVRESLDVVGRVPPRASYRAKHDIVVVAAGEESENSAEDAEIFGEYCKSEMHFFENLHGRYTHETLEKMKLEDKKINSEDEEIKSEDEDIKSEDEELTSEDEDIKREDDKIYPQDMQMAHGYQMYLNTQNIQPEDDKTKLEKKKKSEKLNRKYIKYLEDRVARLENEKMDLDDQHIKREDLLDPKIKLEKE